MVAAFIIAILLSMSFLSGCEAPQSVNSLTLRKDTGHVSGGYTFLSVQSEQAWTLEVTYPGEQRDWVELSRTSGSGTLNSIIVSFEENDGWDERSAVIKAHFPTETLSAVLKQKGLSSLKAGGEGTVLPQWEDFPGLKSEVLPGWIELPAVYEIEGCAWVHHDMEVPAASYKGRNFSIFYDASLFMPRWVAYPLTPTLAGKGTRSDDWDQWDPKIPEQYQPTTQDTWGHKDYQRGHMLPSADRLASEDANRQTFYPTNMTVQLGALNTGTWMNLETHVRSWAKQCDTLYVATGTVPSSMSHIDKGGKAVNIPAGYYKVLLKYNKGRSVRETYAGIAFYLDHQAHFGSVSRDIAMPICELERKLGINFFINLPDEYVDYAESTVSYSEWGL
jgi:endonuclease G